MHASLDGASWAATASFLGSIVLPEKITVNFVFSASFVVLLPAILCYYVTQPLYAREGALLRNKLVTVSVLSAINLSIFVRWQMTFPRPDVEVQCLVAEIAATLCLGVVLYLEHRHSLRSSTPLTVYLLFGVAIDGVQALSFLNSPETTKLGHLIAATSLAKLFIVGLQELPKRSLLIAICDQQRSVLETCGFLSRTAASFAELATSSSLWAELLMRYPSQLDADLSPRRLYAELNAHWDLGRRTKSTHCLLQACLRAWKGHLLLLTVLRLFVTVLYFTQPLLVRHVIELVEQQSNGLTHKQDVREALRNAFLWFLALAVFRTAYEHFLNRYVTRLRGGIIALIIHKCHSLKEANAKRSAIIIRDDVAFITISTPKCLQIVIGFIEIGFGTYMLSQCMGVFALSLFLPLSASTVVAWFIWRPLVNQVHKWNEEIAARVEKSAHLLPQLNSIKILGLGSTLARLLQALRDHEIKVSMGYRYLQAVCYGPLLVGDLMPPVVAIAAALFGAAFQGRMSAKEVFPLLTNVFIIQRASGGFLETYAKKTSTLAAFHRIQDFLLLEEEKDSRFKGESNTQDQQETNLVRFNSVDIAPSGSKKPLIKSVDFKLAAGSISFLFGLPTSGKSTIINGILGQSETLGGSIHVYPDRIGYCDETAWLRDVSIRENIVCTSEFDRDRLDMVLQACFLDEDLAWLPGGEEYIAGVNGCRLTSGQRQRVGIARTAYAGYPLTILDNPFSALDHNTAVCILYQLCGRNGIFRRSRSTVLIATHLPDCLTLADQLLMIENQHCAVLTERAEMRRYSRRLAVALSILNSNAPIAKEKRERDAIRRSFIGHEAAEETFKKEVHEQGHTGLYLYFIDPIGRLKMSLYGLFVSIFAAGEVIPEIYLHLWIQLEPENSSLFFRYLSIVVLTCFMGCLCSFILHVLLVPKASRQIYQRMVDTTIGSTFRHLSANKVDMIVNDDVRLLSTDIPQSFLRTIHCGTNTLIQIGIILSGASYLFSAWPIVLAAIFYIHQHYISTLGKVRRLDDQQSALLQKYCQETAAGSVHIAAFDWHKESISRGLMLLKESQLPFYTRLTIQQWLTMVLNFLCAGLGISVVGLALLIKQSSNASIIGLALLSLNTLSIAVHNTLSARIMFETASSVLARLSLFERETPQDIHRPTLNDLPSHWPSEGRIEFANVVAKYTPTDPEATPALHDVSLTISAGQRVGITGRGGSGKSSLLLAILGFIHYDGRIEIDGIDVQSVSCEDLRSRLVTITQEQVQFDTTIRANLLPFDMHSNLPVQEDEDDKLKQILKSLHIWVPLAEKGGLDAMMNEVGYSKDEKQLLCIARAIAKQRRTGSKVVLVDEATTTVKPAIAKIIHGVMKDYLTGCTILYLAHRAADLDNVDNVVWLRHGALLDEEDSRFESESSGDEDEE